VAVLHLRIGGDGVSGPVYEDDDENEGGVRR
jgi:hypothetical protein